MTARNLTMQTVHSYDGTRTCTVVDVVQLPIRDEVGQLLATGRVQDPTSSERWATRRVYAVRVSAGRYEWYDVASAFASSVATPAEMMAALQHRLVELAP